MASVCEVCGKKPSFGMSVSHSHRRTKRRWNPNIHMGITVVSQHQKIQRHQDLAKPSGSFYLVL